MIDRYALAPVRDLWTERAQYERWLEVECAVAAAWEDLGVAPAGTADRIRQAAVIDVDDIHAIEATVDHDVIAFIKSTTRVMGMTPAFSIWDDLLGCRRYGAGSCAEAVRTASPGTAGMLHGVCRPAVRYRSTVVVGGLTASMPSPRHSD